MVDQEIHPIGGSHRDIPLGVEVIKGNHLDMSPGDSLLSTMWQLPRLISQEGREHSVTSHNNNDLTIDMENLSPVISEPHIFCRSKPVQDGDEKNQDEIIQMEPAPVKSKHFGKMAILGGLGIAGTLAYLMSE